MLSMQAPPSTVGVVLLGGAQQKVPPWAGGLTDANPLYTIGACPPPAGTEELWLLLLPAGRTDGRSGARMDRFRARPFGAIAPLPLGGGWAPVGEPSSVLRAQVGAESGGCCGNCPSDARVDGG
jgi:hypothetical protein